MTFTLCLDTAAYSRKWVVDLKARPHTYKVSPDGSPSLVRATEATVFWDERCPPATGHQAHELLLQALSTGTLFVEERLPHPPRMELSQSNKRKARTELWGGRGKS